MTANQSAVFNFIKNYMTAHNGSSPSYQQIADALGFAHRSRIHPIILALVKQNYIEKFYNTRRSFRIVTHYCPHCHTLLSAL